MLDKIKPPNHVFPVFQVRSRISDRQVAMKGFVQITETRSTLRRKLFFLPGYNEKC